jgi:hypothetical protein
MRQRRSVCPDPALSCGTPATVLYTKQAQKGPRTFLLLTEDQVVERLTALERASGVQRATASNVRRMAGGASKRQPPRAGPLLQ